MWKPVRTRDRACVIARLKAPRAPPHRDASRRDGNREVRGAINVATRRHRENQKLGGRGSSKLVNSGEFAGGDTHTWQTRSVARSAPSRNRLR